jgi:SLT domain-containing protein
VARRACARLAPARDLHPADEAGTSLEAAGWRVVGEVQRDSWNTPARPRDDRDERVPRLRWEPAA